MKKIFLIAGLLGLLSCGPPVNAVFHTYTKSYVTEYYSVSGIEAVFWGEKWINGNYFSGGARIELRVIPDGNAYGVLSDDEDAKARYEALCALHGDNTYNRTVSYSEWESIPHRFQDRDYVGVAITSDQDWDEAHPAGTSLNDVFYFASSSPTKYIERGYEDPYDWRNSAPLPDYYVNYLDHTQVRYMGNEPVYGITSELTANDLILLGGTEIDYLQATFAALTPVAEPALSKTHNISIVLTDTAGNELTAQVAAAFETSP